MIYQNKTTVITKNEILIGYIVEKPPAEILLRTGIPTELAQLAFSNGIWLQRTTQFSFIPQNDIVQVRPTTIFDKEIDNR